MSMNSLEIRNTVNILESLPALPKIAREILAINLATDSGDEKLLKLVEQDPAISARIVGLANSPLFGTSRKIMTTNDAAAVLGIKRIKMIALSFAMMSSLTRKHSGLFDATHLWQHSIAIALAMDTLSKAMPPKMRPPDEEIYLAGLLHDIGFLVLDYIDPDLSNRFHARLATEGGEGYTKLEAEMLELNHCELGALLAEHWNITPGIVAVLRYHHSGDMALDAPGQPLIAMTHLAGNLFPAFGADKYVESKIEIAKWLELGIDAGKVDEVEAAMRKRAEEIASAIS
ncbi:MAG: HDOD domain-containing protein [Gallionellaceae bacterium]|nr:MAG: HDOD domain-containing protein [Gallionellaceae bacterium]